jgi:hypothetical protein
MTAIAKQEDGASIGSAAANATAQETAASPYRRTLEATPVRQNNSVAMTCSLGSDLYNDSKLPMDSRLKDYSDAIGRRVCESGLSTASIAIWQ